MAEGDLPKGPEDGAFARGNAFARAVSEPAGPRSPLHRLARAALLVAVATLLVLALLTAGLLVGGLLHAAIGKPIAILALLCLAVLFAAMRPRR